jgi:hypothetical protein
VAKQQYKIGDIFQIPLSESGKNGFGRILKIDRDIILIELYKNTLNEAFLPEIILSVWASNLGLKKGIWKIINNIPVPSNYQYPIFYHIDALTNKIYILSDESRTEITKDQIGNAQPSGIFGFESVRIRYVHELKNAGVWDYSEVETSIPAIKESADIFSSDIALDVKDFFIRRISRKGAAVERVVKFLYDRFSEALQDEDDSDIIYLALASLQVDKGCLQTEVKQNALEVIESGRNLERWRESGDDDLWNERRGHLEELKQRLLLYKS